MTRGSAIRIKPFVAPAAADGSTGIVIYKSDKTFVTSSNILVASSSAHFANCTYEQESANVYKIRFNDDLPTTYAYVRLTIPIADGADAYVTYDAEMPNAEG